MNKLTELFPKDELNLNVEVKIDTLKILIEKGYYLEVYFCPVGKFNEESSEGISHFIYIDMPIYLDTLFEHYGYNDQDILGDLLSITILGINEESERELCLENRISTFMLPDVLSDVFRQI